MSSILQNNSCTVVFNGKSNVKSNCAQEQEVNDLIEFLKLEYKNYIRYKILYSILEEYINEEKSYNVDLKGKVRNIMTHSSVSQTVSINGKSDSEISILGVKNISSMILSYTERNRLTEALKIKIEEKNSVFNNYLRSLRNTHVTYPDRAKKDCSLITSLNLNLEDKLLISCRENLLSEQEQYINNLLQLRKLLQEMTEIRLKLVPETTELKIKEYQTRDKINQVKSIFTEQKCRLDIFRETNYSLKAYKELIQDIKSQQQGCRKEISDLMELKEKYNQVSCKQYQDILESYLRYLTSVERKKRLYNCLKK